MKELIRNEMINKLSGKFTSDQLNTIIMTFDECMNNYTVSKEETALSTDVYIPIKELIKTYIVVKSMQGLSKLTLENTLRNLNIFADTVKKPLEKMTVNDIRLYLYQYKQKRNICDRTLDSYQKQLKGFIKWCYNEGYIPKNISDNLSSIKYAKRQKEALTQMELEKLREACRNSDESLRDICLIEVLYSTGCRVSEIKNIKTADINKENYTIKVVGKGNKERVVYLNAKAMLAIENYIASKDFESEYLFSHKHNGNSLCPRQLLNIIDGLGKAAGIKHITPHTMRHTTATVAVQNGMPITDIQRMLGHSSIQTTMIYAQVDDKQVQNNHQRCVI